MVSPSETLWQHSTALKQILAASRGRHCRHTQGCRPAVVSVTLKEILSHSESQPGCCQPHSSNSRAWSIDSLGRTSRGEVPFVMSQSLYCVEYQSTLPSAGGKKAFGEFTFCHEGRVMRKELCSAYRSQDFRHAHIAAARSHTTRLCTSRPNLRSGLVAPHQLQQASDHMVSYLY